MPRRKGHRSALAKAMNEKKQINMHNMNECPSQPASDTISENMPSCTEFTSRTKNIRQQKLEGLCNRFIMHRNDVNERNYIIVDVCQLAPLMTNVLCPICLNKSLRLKVNKSNGLVHTIGLECIICNESNNSVHTSSRLVTKKSVACGPFDLNRRITQAFLHIGKGHSALEEFSMIMNMPCISDRAFYDHAKNLNIATSEAVSEVLEHARCEVRKAYAEISERKEDACFNICVSFDGTWLTRGHMSQYGVGCVIDVLTGYCIDFEVMSKYCQVCKIAARDLGKNSPEFKFWYDGHFSECDINHCGSSGAMEMEAAAIIWLRSEKYGLRYTTMLSDGDAKTHSKLRELMPYGPGEGNAVEKEECINHVGKRLISGLRGVRTSLHGQGVKLGGRGIGTLKDVTIAKLGEYYKNAIRNNIGDLGAMKTAVYATLYHNMSTDQKPQHSKCPKGPNSWCFYQRASAEGRQPPPHKDSIGHPLREDLLPKILPVYQRLASDALLSRCLRGETQNANESLHSMIWRKCPKTTFVSKGLVEFAVGQAVCEFNVGSTVTRTQKAAGISAGGNTKELAHMRDQKRVRNANLRREEKLKKARQVVRLAKLRHQ